MHPAVAGGLKGALSGYLGPSGLGDAGVPNDDVSYTGADPNDAFSMAYYIDKARQFQVVMDALDAAASAAENMMAVAMTGAIVDGEDTDQLVADLSAYLDDFSSKRVQFRLTAEAINGGAATINALGGRFPELSIPSGLGLAPIVMGGAAIAAIAVAASLIVWGNTWIKGLNARMATAAAAAMIDDPTQKAAFLTAAAVAQAATDASDNPLSTVANIAKWGAILFGLYMAFKTFGHD